MSDSDDGGSSARRPSVASRPTATSTTASSTSASTAAAARTPDEISTYIRQFIKDVQPRHIKSKQKQVITSFARWYFTQKPVLSERDITILLLGESNEGRKGLIETCGNTNLKSIGDIKASSILALELVAMLCDSTLNTAHSQTFIEYLPKIPLKYLQAMKLEKHLLSETSDPEHACKILHLLQIHIPAVPIVSYLDGSSDALKTYEEWVEEHIDAEEDEDASEGPRTWAQVKLDDMDKEEAAYGMEIEDEHMLTLVAQEKDAETRETTQLDPLGLVRINTSARDTKGGPMNAKNKRGDSSFMSTSNKRMKNFWKKLMKQKELSANRAAKAMSGGGGGGGSDANANDSDEEYDEAESTDHIHLIDEITSMQLGDVTNKSGISTGSINVELPDFNPIMFLHSIHSNTSLTQLERGLGYLQKSLNDRTEQMKLLVKQHFGSYVYCKDTIDHLHELLSSEIQQQQQNGGSSKAIVSNGRSMKLLRDIESVRQECEELYRPLLQRKTESDQIRQVLSILQRFKFLFSLPKKLKEKKGGWEQVIRDYQKAKQFVVMKSNSSAASTANNFTSPISSPMAVNSNTTTTTSGTQQVIPNASNSVSLASIMQATAATAASSNNSTAYSSLLASPSILTTSSTPPGIPESILLEIVTLVRSLRGELFKQLDQLAAWEEHEKVIGYLLSLDCESDPSWYFLTKQCDLISQGMEKILHDFCTKIEQALNGSSIWKVWSYVPPPSSSSLPTLGAFRLLHGSIPFSSLVLHSNETISALSKFIRKLCSYYVRALPEFMELANHTLQKFGQWTSPNAGAGVTDPTMMGGGENKQRMSFYETMPGLNATIATTPGASPALTSSSASPGTNGTTSSSSPQIPTPLVVETQTSVAKLVSMINAQFVRYVKITLFTAPTTTNINGVNASNGASKPPLAGKSANSAAASSSLTTAPHSSCDDISPAYTFPPNMYTHVHDILSCCDTIRTHAIIPQDYTLELKHISDQLIDFYLEFHIRELLQAVAGLHKDETWELDSIHRCVADNDNGAGGGSNNGGLFDSFLNDGEDGLDFTNGPLGHGHAGTSATNAPFQITCLPSYAYDLISNTIQSFSALPTISSKWIVERMVGAIFEAMKLFADGQHACAIQIRNTQDASGFGSTNLQQQQQQQVQSLTSSLSSPIPLHNTTVLSWIRPLDTDRNLLLLWSNIIYTRDQLLYPLFDELCALLPDNIHQQIENKFHDDIVSLYQDLLEDKLLLSYYTKYKILRMNTILGKGYFKNGLNWSGKKFWKSEEQVNGGKTNVNSDDDEEEEEEDNEQDSNNKNSNKYSTQKLVTRSCILEFLLQFVLIHEELFTIRKEEVDRVIEMILEKAAVSVLDVAKEIEGLCDTSGANQFLFELSCITTTLAYYLTDESTRIFDLASDLLTSRLESEVMNAVGRKRFGSVVDQTATERTLALQQWQHASGSMFTCFASVKIRRRKETGK